MGQNTLYCCEFARDHQAALIWKGSAGLVSSPCGAQAGLLAIGPNKTGS